MRVYVCRVARLRIIRRSCAGRRVGLTPWLGMRQGIHACAQCRSSNGSLCVGLMWLIYAFAALYALALCIAWLMCLVARRSRGTISSPRQTGVFPSANVQILGPLISLHLLFFTRVGFCSGQCSNSHTVFCLICITAAHVWSLRSSNG